MKKMPLEEFKRNATIFKHIRAQPIWAARPPEPVVVPEPIEVPPGETITVEGVNFDEDKNISIEYKAYEAFLESVKPKESKEFFNEGKITLGDWILYSDLEIGSVKEKRRRESILSCTDGGSYGLPYFDRLLQKYFYLKHNPDKILEIGKRHLGHERGEDLFFEDAEDRALTEVTYDFDAIKKMGKLICRPEEKLKITNMPDIAFDIFQYYYHWLSFKKGKEVVIIEHACKTPRQRTIRRHLDEGTDAIEDIFMNPSARHKIFCFKNYYSKEIEKYMQEKDFDTKGLSIDRLFDLGDAIFKTQEDGFIPQRQAINLLAEMLLKEKDYFYIPIGVLLLAVVVLEKEHGVFDIIEFYEKNTDKQTDYKGKPIRWSVAETETRTIVGQEVLL